MLKYIISISMGIMWLLPNNCMSFEVLLLILSMMIINSKIGIGIRKQYPKNRNVAKFLHQEIPKCSEIRNTSEILITVVILAELSLLFWQFVFN